MMSDFLAWLTKKPNNEKPYILKTLPNIHSRPETQQNIIVQLTNPTPDKNSSLIMSKPYENEYIYNSL